LDDLKNLPIQSFGVEEVSEELGEVPNLIGLVFKDSMKVLYEGLDEVLLEHVFQFAEPLGKQPEEFLVDALHHAALNDHIAKFIFVAFGNPHF